MQKQDSKGTQQSSLRTGLHHGKACLHEHDHGSADDQPDKGYDSG